MRAKTTLAEIRRCGPCETGWATLLRSLPSKQRDDDPITFLHILKSNGLDDAVWALRTNRQAAEHFARGCVRAVRALCPLDALVQTWAKILLDPGCTQEAAEQVDNEIMDLCGSTYYFYWTLSYAAEVLHSFGGMENLCNYGKRAGVDVEKIFVRAVS